MHDSYIRYSAEEKECIVLSVKRSELSIIPHWFGWGISCLCKNQEPQKIPISMDKSPKMSLQYIKVPHKE